MTVVRKAREEDIPLIAKFQVQMAWETEGISLEDTIVLLGVQHVFKNRECGFYIVSEIEKNVVASMLLTPEWSDWRNSEFLWIQSLYVLPEFRKMNVFRNMFSYIKKIVDQSENYGGLKLYVENDNSSAKRAYLNVGMHSSRYRLFEWNKKEY